MSKLPQWIQQLSGSDESIEPVLVPGNWFVCRAFALPEELKAKEIEEFAELRVEEISPFNLEQLNWGFFHSEETGRIFTYAAYDQKLRKDLADSEVFDYAFPDFAQTFGLTFGQATLVFLIHESTLTGILLPANDPVPQTVVGITLDVEFSRDDLTEAKQSISERIENQVNRLTEPTRANPVASFRDVAVSDKIYARNWEFKESKSKPSIQLIPYGDEAGTPWQVTIPETSRLWAMDIRKTEEKEQLVKKQGWTLWYWRASVSVLLLFLLLAFAEIGLVGLSKWNEKELLVALEKQPLAEEVQQKADILAKINQITTNQLLPFEMLDVVNQARPTNIYFTRVSAEGGNALQIEAVGLPGADINSYQQALKEIPNVSLVEISNNRVRNDLSSFRLRVEFNQGALQPQTFLTDL